ncbi:hypothetical protein E4U50_005807 [Claviceps purpurea]|nr:hypothetical protein E4U50_005807 [Claviceps purpurea]
MKRFSTALTITDPLAKYQTLLRAGVYSPDPAQHRLARHLQVVYRRIKDYSPQEEYRQRLNQVARFTEPQAAADRDQDDGNILALRHHSIWRNPLFKHLLPSSSSAASPDSLALIRVLSDHETAMEIDSPKGLFVSGEVGTGKSMLLDLLAEGLPTEGKRRWHFNTFMLYIFSQLDKHRKSLGAGSEGSATSEFSLVWMAKKLVDESPILFLDEFQLPDRAASKILSHLFVSFFQLGGVLVASSNRMPDELQNATGMDYRSASGGGFIRKFFGGGNDARRGGDLYGPSSDFANFLNVLKARCDFWHMEGATDWRRKEEKGVSVSVPSSAVGLGVDAVDANESSPTSDAPTAEEASTKRKVPVHYHLHDGEDALPQKLVQDAVGWHNSDPVPWQESALVVYGRRVVAPQHYNGSVFWTFDQLVESFGPADYITMASSYHTFIIDRVPILTVLHKNEARRFITFLDALYEARCKLVILRAQRPPDDLFFPENKKAASAGTKDGESINSGDVHADATYSETVAEVYQDQTSPFRPNVSYYDTESSTAKYNADQDSDFGLQKKKIDFGNTSAFTGEDERFAYKRATSRLWELCSAAWHARTGDWWQPLPLEARHWEGGPRSQPLSAMDVATTKRDAGEKMGESVDIDVAGLSKWKVEELRQQHEK